MRDMKGSEKKSDWDKSERKLRERSRRVESGLNLIKAGDRTGRDRPELELWKV